MSKALTIRTTDMTTWQTIQSIAPVVQASRMFKVTQEQAAIVMLKGHELGLGMAAAFEFIDVIDSKPSIKPKGALALIHQCGELEKMKITMGNDSAGKLNSCTVYMKRSNGFEFESTFTMEDAEQAELVKKGSAWEKYPSNMLRWRAIGYVADIVFPDVIGGLYRPEELGATVNASGEQIIDAMPEIIQTPPVANIPTPKPEWTLLQLTHKYSPQQMMAVNGGKIPATNADCARIAQVLGLIAEYGNDVVIQANGGKMPTTQEEVDVVAYNVNLVRNGG